MTASQHSSNALDIITTARNAQASGDNTVAEFNYARAVQMSPGDFEPMLEFGVFLASIGRFADAKSQLRKAHEANPENADVSHNLGELALLDEEFSDAAEHFSSAVEQDPGFIDARYGLARAYHATRQFQNALQAIDGCLQQSAKDPDFLHLKALILRDLGRFREAIALLNDLLTNSPRQTDAAIDLANMLSLDAHVQEAAEILDDTLNNKTAPNGYLAKCAGIYLRANRLEKAKKYATDALAANEDTSLANYWLARIHGNEGDFEAAEKFAMQSLSGSAQDARAYQLLARIKRPVTDMAERVQEVLEDTNSSNTSRVAAGYTAFSLANASGQYDAAFEALKTANLLQSSQVSWSVDDQEAQLQHLIEFFKPEFFANLGLDSGYDGEGAVFIVGMPRSGTTLTEQILAAHPRVESRGELYAVRHALKSLPSYPDSIGDMTAEWSQEAGRLVHEAMLDGCPAGVIATDKLPTSYHHIGLLCYILPKSQFVFCHRNPYDNALSLFEQDFGRSHPYVCDLNNIKQTILQHYRIMKHWIDSCGIDTLVVDYDDLVVNPEKNIRTLLDGLELDWNDACLAPHLVERSVSTASDWQVRQPISPSSVGRWRRFEDQLMEALGQMPTWNDFISGKSS